MGCNINVGSPILRTDLAQSIRLTTRVDKEILCQDFQDASVKIADVEIPSCFLVLLVFTIPSLGNSNTKTLS